MNTKWELSRRALLRELGVGLGCLPLLRAGRADGAPPTKKMVVVAAIHGYQTAAWQPPNGPLTAPLPKSASPLEGYKDRLIFLHDLANKAGTACGTCGPREYGVVYYGLPVRPQTLDTYLEPDGPTVDHVVASGLPGKLPTLPCAVQIDLPPSIGTTGHRRCFWAEAGSPTDPELDPFALYARLFGGAQVSSDAAAVRLLAERKSMLDYVGGSLTRFRGRLGSDDRLIIDQHLEAVRAVERQLSPLAPLGGQCGGDPGMAVDLQSYASYPIVLNAFLGLIVAALKCGVTQVATLQLADSWGDNVDFSAFVPGLPPVGVKSPFRTWHDLAEDPVQAGVDHKQIVDQWWMSKLAGFLAQLQAAADPGGGTLLDNSVVLWGNDLHDWSRRDGQALPWLLAGSCAGYFKTGQCLGGNNTAMVMADLCNAMGVTSHPYGAGYPGLKA